MSRNRRIAAACAVLSLLSVVLVPARAGPDADHRVLASGQLKLGNIYRDRFRRLLTTDGLGAVRVFDATLEGYQFQATADLDLHVENTLTPDAIVDFTNRVHAEFDDPDDIQGGRYRFIDNRFAAVWGLALDSDTTLKTEFLVRNHLDVLFPETNAISGDLSLTLDTALDHDSWVTFLFAGDATAFDENESPDYFEGFGRVAFNWYNPRRARYSSLPSPVSYPAQPEPRGANDAFRYGPEVGLHESKKLFPLGQESLIGRAAPAPLIVSPSDRLFREVEQSAPSYAELSIGVRGRDYRDVPFSDWRRLEVDAGWLGHLARGLTLEVGNAFVAAEYALPQPVNTQTDRLSDRLRFEFVRTRKRARQTARGAVAFYRFPGAERFDLNQYELGASSLQAFGRRYWLFSDLVYVAHVPEDPQASYPERDQVIATMGFTVDFSPLANLTVATRQVQLDIPRFETFFDFDYTDQAAEIRYHHQIQRRFAIEGGVRSNRRHSESQPDNNRRENLVFLDTVLEL
jgi:hypothetical protein